MTAEGFLADSSILSLLGLPWFLDWFRHEGRDVPAPRLAAGGSPRLHLLPPVPCWSGIMFEGRRIWSLAHNLQRLSVSVSGLR